LNLKLIQASKKDMKRLFHFFCHAIFWGWNFTFLTSVGLGILPVIGIPLIVATFEGQVPIEFFLTLNALVAVPTICTAIGYWRFRKFPLQLLRLFYCVEVPLFLLCILRLFIFRELTPASTQILLSVGICIFASLGNLFYTQVSQRRSLAWLQGIAYSLMVLVGLYGGILLLFYAVPATVVLVQEFLKFQWLGILWDSLRYGYFLWLPLFLILWGVSCTLFVVMPPVMTSLYVYSGLRGVKTFAAQYGQTRALAAALGTLVASFTLFFAFQQQPQIKAFSLLEPPAQTASTRQALLAQSDAIQSGLLNAYLSNFRYLSSKEENNQIWVMYDSTFKAPKEILDGLQNTYNWLMSPFLYQGSQADIQKAQKLYAEFFDTSIQKGEREAINHALQSTFNRDEAKAGLLNLNQQKVWLRSQEIKLQERGDWADIELHEVYENQTPDMQEVFYSFSLPESAVITGLWLGDTADKSKRFEFVVSPRGAAQQVYNEQVQIRVDPALLEQVGPRHYRLRAFPVPTKLMSWERQGKIKRPTEMHLWLTYKLMRQEKGWALPQLGEKRNIYWTNFTKRIRNGKESGKLDAWVEDYLSASGSDKPILHTTQLAGDYQITAKPLTQKDYSLPQNQRFAIVLDTSRSMKTHLEELTDTFSWLDKRGFANKNLADNDADLYVTSSPGATPKRLDDLSQFKPAKATYYGTLQLKKMLQQFEQLRGDTAYDGILLVTDEGSYELSDDEKNVPAISAPLWMVHLGALPPAYDDGVLKTIENSGGGVSTEVAEVLQRMATKSTLGSTTVSVVDGYAWSMEKTPQTKIPASDAFEPVAARQLVLGLSREKDLDTVVELDAIHAIAKNYKIVTPYSSMLVLVNDQQRQALKEAEAKSDRFEREVESGQEELTQPNNPLNAEGVPEPSQIGGAVLAILGLGWLLRTKQRHRHLKIER
jgi:putative PEP-CTERM system integral membrane protein